MLRFRWIIQLICRSKFDRWNFIPSRPFELTNDLYVQRVCMHVRCIPSWGNISFREMRFNFETMRRSPRIFASFVSICQGFWLFAIPSPSPTPSPRYFMYPCFAYRGLGFSKLANIDIRNRTERKYQIFCEYWKSSVKISYYWWKSIILV